MADKDRTRTPPPPRPATTANPPVTPEQVRRMEESRLRAKALRSQREAAASTQTPGKATTYPVAGQKRAHATTVDKNFPANSRDARNAHKLNSNNGPAQSADTDIRPARKFQKYVEYDFSKMTDTKGGFMTHEDDPHNKTLNAPDADGKPAHMSLKEWETQQLQRRLRNQRAGPYEPGLSVFKENAKKCRECGSLEIDWQWEEVFHIYVCNTDKERYPEKYSLLTKTEAKEDYLLTDPELKDEALLPHLEKPNPHKAHWNSMMLYLRCQVEEYAFSDRKWGNAKALDEEFEKRQKDAKDRKEKKFKNKLQELKKRTRVDAYKRARGGGGGDFGDAIVGGKHEHEWGRSVDDPETGMMKKRCNECGMEVEELELEL